MNNDNYLKNRCKVATQEENNRFVGIKADNNNAIVYFPLGYHLTDNDYELRKDIIHLFSIISDFKNKDEGNISKKNFDEIYEVNFPLNAYMEIINYYMEYGYYKEIDSFYKTSDMGKVNWQKTIKEQNPLVIKTNIQTFYPVYNSFTVKKITPNENEEITLIHKHCVYESFKKIGWIFTSYMPSKPLGVLNKNNALIILRDKLANTNNDIKKRLFQSMIEMISNMDENIDNQLYFGTEKFEYILEGLIDKTFGINNKEDYFPKADWNLHYNDNKSTYPLQPDTIMELNDKIYIIDAKYYKYGSTRDSKDLPDISSINKQITYGEFINKFKGGTDKEIFNAFLLPYNKENNLFKEDNLFMNVGEAVGQWKSNKHKFEHVQCLLIDIKYLMYNYKNSSKKENIIKLANAIEEAYEKNYKFYEINGD